MSFRVKDVSACRSS